MPFNFRPIPELGTVEELRQWLNEEFKTLSQAFGETTELELRPSRHEPTRPRDGMIVHADGTSWNPGSGAGTYRRQNGLWVKVPSSATDFGSLFGYGRTSAGDVTLTRADSGVAHVNFNAVRTVNLPTCAGNEGVNFFFYALTGGGTTTTTIIPVAGQVIIAPDGVTFSNGSPLVITTNQRIGIVTDGANWIAFTANFRGAFPQGNGVIWDSTSIRTVQQMSITADGSGLKLVNDANTPGNSKYYGTDSGGTKGFFDFVSGGLTQLVNASSLNGIAQPAFTNLGGYKILWVVVTNAQQSSGTSRIFQMEISGNNGSSYGGIKQPFGAVGVITTNLVIGHIMITRADQVNNQMVFQPSVITAAAGAQLEATSIGPINALRLSWSSTATNFTGGTIDIWGLK